MAESKTKVMHNGKMVDGMDVPIKQPPNEQWSEYQLEDGTKVRLKFVVVSIIRVDGEYDQEANPIYAVKGNLVAVPTVPDNLRKKG